MNNKSISYLSRRTSRSGSDDAFHVLQMLLLDTIHDWRMKEVICRLVVALEATDKASLQATYEYNRTRSSSIW